MTDFTAQSIETLVKLGAVDRPPISAEDGSKYVLVPAGYTAHKILPAEHRLVRIRQSVTMHDRDSFVDYVNRYKTDATRLFAEPGFLAGGSASISAVLDYHTAAVDNADPGEPDYCAHIATYVPRYSEQWQRWTAACQQPMRQSDFAEFIEEIRADITEPSAAQLLDIVRGFKASKKVEFDSVVYQPNGDVRLAYDEQTEQRGTSGVLPEKMKIGIPVYFRGTPYAVEVFVRYKVGSGAVAFQLKIDRADVVEDYAFSELTAVIAEKAGVQPYLGRRV